MASQVPAVVKDADLLRFAIRASQLEKAKPIISYYCKFWIVNQIISKNLHATDDNCLVYTTNLVEKLEQFKAENRDNDAVTDNLAGKAYVEQFGLETLQRAENAMRANKASRQTADTLQAAATFLELQQIWGEIDPDNAAKIKYAKYHALRIAKALKAGQDPNASNPTPEASGSAQDNLPGLDPNDAEVQTRNGNTATLRQPSVVDVPDETDQVQEDLARQSPSENSLFPSKASLLPRPTVTVPRSKAEDIPNDTDRLHGAEDQSMHQSRAVTFPQPSEDDVSPVDASATAEDFYHNTSHYDVSPLGPEPPASEKKFSSGGNYFPHVPPRQRTSPPRQQQEASLDLPSAPPHFTSPSLEPTLPPADATRSSASSRFSTPTQPPLPPLQPQSAPDQPISNLSPDLRKQQQQQRQPPQRAYAPPSAVSAGQQASIAVDEEAMAMAQKHARWAISALNFEDVPTAIRELRGALEVLGAK